MGNKSFSIAIASGKGGTGKTLIATSLATSLGTTNKVVLVDLDVEEPNVHVFFPKKDDVSNKKIMRYVPQWSEICGHCGICASLCKFGALLVLPNKVLVFSELCHGCYLCSDICPEGKLPMVAIKTGDQTTWSSHGISIVEGCLLLGEESGSHLIGKVREHINNEYKEQIKIIDCPPGTSCNVIESMRNVDFVVLVTEPTPFGLHDLSIAIELTKYLRMPAGVIVNRFGIGDADIEALCREQKIPLLARIPESKTIAKEYAAGIHPLPNSQELQTGIAAILDYCKNELHFTMGESL